MKFDIRAAISRLKSSKLNKVNSITYANPIAGKQFNIYLNAAKKQYPYLIDLAAFDELYIPLLEIGELKDSIEKLSDSLLLIQSNEDEFEVELSQKFGILRSVNQLEKDFELYSTDFAGVGLIFFDIDNFKKHNTDYTETIVDEKLLNPFQKFILNFTQSRGFCYSVGGDEYIILVRNANKKEVFAFAERLRETIESKEFEINAAQVKFTVSIGISSYPEDAKELQTLKEYANKAESIAKTKGKNQVVIWNESIYI